jgi:type I restriction enzyme R subunit
MICRVTSMVEAIDTEEVWLADKRVELVTRHIINNHDKYTRVNILEY